MGGFSRREFIDVLGEWEGPAAVVPRPGDSPVVRLNKAAAALTFRGGGFLYVPETLVLEPEGTVAGRAWRPTVYVPANVTMLFKSGALLDLRAGVILEIEGGIAHGARQLFRVPDADGVHVVMTGYQLPRVYPEWWGAGAGRDDTVALQAAVDAACNLRRLGPRVGTQLPPVELSLAGRYVVRAPIEVGYRDALPQPTELPEVVNASAKIVGTRGADGEVGTIVAGAGFVDRAPAQHHGALVRLRDVFGWSVENVVFDAVNRAARCVVVDISPPRPGTTRQDQAGSLRRCTFRGATDTLVNAGAVGQPRGPKGAPPAKEPSGGDLLCLRFEGCGFFPVQDQGIGLQLRAGNTLPMVVTGCVFEGTAAAMIYALAGSFTVEGCRFRNDREPRNPPKLEGPGTPDGSDIYLGHETFEGGATTTSPPPRAAGDAVRDPQQALPGDLLPRLRAARQGWYGPPGDPHRCVAAHGDAPHGGIDRVGVLRAGSAE